MNNKHLHAIMLVFSVAFIPNVHAEDRFPWKNGERVRLVFATDPEKNPTSCGGEIVRKVRERYPGRKITFISEANDFVYDNIHTYLAKFDTVIAADKPTYVVLSPNVVNLWPLYRSKAQTPLIAPWELHQLKNNHDGEQRFEADLLKMIGLIHQRLRAPVAVATISDVANFPLHERQMLDTLNEAIRRVARAGNVVLIEANLGLRRLIEEGRVRRPPVRFHLPKNQVTLNEAAESALAEIYLHALGFPRAIGPRANSPLTAKPLDARDDSPTIEPEMITIPAGPFRFGPPGNERQVDLPAFDIDRCEVTCAMYQRFIAATGRAAPPGWSGKRCRKGQANLPVTNVTFADAQEYARWAGKRLPTEEEWEKAARGTNGTAFPWGDAFEAARANTWESGLGRPAPVGSRPKGASPSGVMDMCGNVFEWTATPHPGFEDMIVVKGGSWQIEAELPTGDPAGNYAKSYSQNKARPDAATTELGFRCAR